MAAADVTAVREYADTSWHDGPTRGVEDVVESGAVLAFPQPRVRARRRREALPRSALGRSARPRTSRCAGRRASCAAPPARPTTCSALRALVVRFAEQSEAFALRLFPHYRGQLRRGNTSFRPTDVAGRVRSWRQDDTRLHVDAFPSNPMQGTRLLRVFCNVNPDGAPRRWRVGEPFEAHAQALSRARSSRRCPARPG